MDLHSNVSDDLVGLMFLAAPAALITGRVITVAIHKMQGSRIPRKSQFISHDITLIVLTLISSAFGLLPAITKYGLSTYLDALSQMRAGDALVGWPLTLLALTEALAVIAVPVMLMIGRHRRSQPRNIHGERYRMGDPELTEYL